MLYCIALFLIYLFLAHFFPKGNPIQEGLYLPIYWLRTTLVPTRSIQLKKYFYGQHKRQYYLWLKPANTTPKRNHIIIYYHGGGWRYGTPEFFKANGKVFTDLGFEVIMPTYRPCPKHNYEHIRADVDATLLHIKELLQKENRWNTKFILGGMSAGGNLVAHILYNQTQLVTLGWQTAQFSGIFLCGAPLDLSKMWDSPPLRHFTGPRKRTIFPKSSPINYLNSPQETPVLFVHGNKDGMVEYESALSFIEKLKTLQSKDITLQTLQGGSHLDAGSWVHTDNQARKWIKDWVLQIETNNQRQGSS